MAEGQNERDWRLGHDFDGVPFPTLLKALATYHASFSDSIKKLQSLKQKVELHKDVFADPDELLRFLDSYEPLFLDFRDDLERLKKQLYAGIKERHLDTIDQIVERYRIERENVRAFIKGLFEDGIKGDVTFDLEIVDEMRATLYEQFIVVGDGLLRLNRRLRTFLGAIPQELETREKYKSRLIPFPAKPGVTWDQVTIRFLTLNTVELRVGDKRRHNEYKDIGFEDRRTHNYIRGWFILAALGHYNGTLKATYPKLPESLRSHRRLVKQIQSLNNLLDCIFEIEGKKRAIEYDWKQSCYRANFRVILDEPELFEEIGTSFEITKKFKSPPIASREDLDEMKFRSIRKKIF